MPSVIGFVHQKGGVGKTTIAVCLAGEFAKRGREITLIDADKTGSARSWSDLDQLQFPVTYMPINEGHGRSWANSMRKIGGDAVLIDCAPNDYSTGAVAALADLAILPCGPSGLDIEGTMQALEIINEARSRRSAPLPVIIVPNRIDSRTLEGRQVIEELKQIGEHVASPVGYRIDFVRAYSTGEAVSTYAPRSVADAEVGALADVVLKFLPKK
jgi:chromosome partitioning protein